MKAMPLTPPELALLAVIRDLTAESGPVHRDTLSVRAKGRGLEVPRSLGLLIERGMVERIQKRPRLLARMFGGRPTVLFRPTPAGLAVDCGAEPADEMAPGPAAAPPPTPCVTPDPPDAETPAAAAKPPLAAPATMPEPRPAEPVDDTARPVPVTQAGPKAADKAPRTAPPAQPAPRAARVDRAQAMAFTEDLGGAPLPAHGVALSHQVDPEVMEGIRDVLAGYGMELTFAGEALIADRLAQGQEPGDALCQVVLFAFAHAAREDLTAEGALGALGLADYAGEIAEELQKLTAAGLIGEARLTQDRPRLLALGQQGDARERLVAEILSDPVGGLLPPALLPGELRPAGEA